MTQLIAVGTTIAYTAVTTFVIFMIIKAVVGIRVDIEEEVNRSGRNPARRESLQLIISGNRPPAGGPIPFKKNIGRQHEKD